ncbi:permease [Vibrio ishigakensis]|uniref:Permease n=1 Tax=Vibrio ishigakensis TaxID=1481914 RepID=A0A0B8QUE0_9VIBR|nr:permease [Vibrio ishigakensis]
MSVKSVGAAMTLLIIGNLVAVLSDALIKSVSASVPVFQFVFFRQLTAVLLLLPLYLFSDKQGLSQGLKWHAARAHVWLLGAIFMVYAIGAMPLATANAIFYAAPLIMLPLAALFFKEQLTKASLLVAAVGFVGVLVIIRPTEISWAAISALVVALTLAVNNLLIRKIPPTQSVVQTLLMTNLVGMPVALGLAVYEGHIWQWDLLPVAMASSGFILVYAATCVFAYRAVESNKIASAEYSGLIGAVLVGVVWFQEIPDIYMLAGTLMIIAPLLWLSKHEKRRAVS